MSCTVYADTTSCVDAKTGGTIFKIKIDWSTNEYQLKPLISVNNRNLYMATDIYYKNSNSFYDYYNGILTQSYIDSSGNNKFYAIYTYRNQVWIAQGIADFDNKNILESGGAYLLSCSKSFIKPFLKHKYS